MGYDIFISYRRHMGIDMAGRIRDRLIGQGYSVFYDIESMHEGEFDEQIYTTIDGCTDFVLVLPPHALDHCLKTDEEDWIRNEISHALKKGKNIIPVMMKGFEMPSKLPEEMDGFSVKHGIEASNNYFDSFIDHLVGMLHTAKPTFAATNGKNTIQEGIRALQHRQYQQAKSYMEEAMRSDISNAEVHFYFAVVLLESKRPFLAMKPTINRIIDCLEVALQIQEEAVYHYLMAYVKYDYHHSKMLRANPDYLYHLQKARELGIGANDIEQLFKLLRLTAPTGL